MNANSYPYKNESIFVKTLFPSCSKKLWLKKEDGFYTSDLYPRKLVIKETVLFVRFLFKENVFIFQ